MGEKLKIASPDADAATIVASLKTCAMYKDLHRGCRIHGDIVRMGLLDSNIYLGNSLINMFAKCGALAKAHEVFNNLPEKNTASWNVLIGGYADHGCGEEALTLFEEMQSKGGLSLNVITLLCTLKACVCTGSTDKGQEIYDKMVRDGLLRTNVVDAASALTSMYAKCGLIERAQDVFDKVLVRNVVSWNVLIAGYVGHGHALEALNCVERMHSEGLFPDAVTYTCGLKSCRIIEAPFKGQQFHAKIGSHCSLKKDNVLANALVDMYAKSGCLTRAHEVFDRLPVQDIMSWNALIAGYNQHGCFKEALYCFEQMQCGGFLADTITIACILRACGSMGDAERGEAIYAQFSKQGLLGNDLVASNALVDMYGKCGMLDKAFRTFFELPLRDVVSWNAIIASYVQHGYGDDALECFEWMQREGASPSAVTFLCILKACSTLRDPQKCYEAHAYIARNGVLEKNMFLGTSLVEMYGSSNMLAEAQYVFDKLSAQDIVSCNALMTGYAQNAHCEEALDCFESLQGEGLSPNTATFVCILKVCGSAGAACKGQEVHAQIGRNEILSKELVIGTALVDMYSGCGMLTGARDVFENLPVHDIVSWNGLILGYSRMGEHESVFHLFDAMIDEGQQPNMATFTILLNTCCHTGLLDKGQICFERMSAYFDIIWSVEHYTCMIDLFCRAGQLDKAVAMVMEMPLSADVTVWHTLLGACQKLGDWKLGRLAFEHAELLDEGDAANYVYMRNVYAAAACGQ